MPSLNHLDSQPFNGAALRVCFIVGSQHTLHCGVKDYAHRLAEALAERDVSAEVHAASDWTPQSFAAFRAMLRARQFDVVHVQYPSIGFRYSLMPHLLGLAGVGRAACVTLHEYSRLPRPQRWSTHLFRLSTQSIVFSTEEERASFEHDAGWLGPRSAVIPIGSNVPVATPSSFARPPRPISVIYFGQIRPDKGLEAFLDLAQLSRRQGRPFEFVVLGSCLPRHADYLAGLRTLALGAVQWRLDESFEAVARTMAEALAAYLPFPDGASFRRGSLVGALVNGTPILTTVSTGTPPELQRAVLAAGTAEEALGQLDRLESSAALATELSRSGRTLSERFSWSSIAEAHDLLYRRLCATARSGYRSGHQGAGEDALLPMKESAK